MYVTTGKGDGRPAQGQRRRFSIATVLKTHTGALREYNKALSLK